MHKETTCSQDFAYLARYKESFNPPASTRQGSGALSARNSLPQHRFEGHYTHRPASGFRTDIPYNSQAGAEQSGRKGACCPSPLTSVPEPNLWKAGRTPPLALPPPIPTQSDSYNSIPMHRSIPQMEPYFGPAPQSHAMSSRNRLEHERRWDNISAIPRASHEMNRIPINEFNNHPKHSATVQSHNSPESIQVTLPPISVLLSKLRQRESSKMIHKEGAPITARPEEKYQYPQHPHPHFTNILPLPRSTQPNSPAGYALPAGEFQRPMKILISPTSLSKAALNTASPPIRRSSEVRQTMSVHSGYRHSFSQLKDERKYPPTRPASRPLHRQTMSETEKRARKALQQQRRRKHGPTREPRERFSEEEDRWLVMEKRRLEREPNKHWTDLEYAHRAKFPNLKDRTLSGLQSRYYRIKKKFPVDPTTEGEHEIRSRWDEEVQDRFPEGADSDGDPEDYEMREASLDEDSTGSVSGAEKGI